MGQPAPRVPAELFIDLGELGHDPPFDLDGESPRSSRGSAIFLATLLVTIGLVADTPRPHFEPVLTTATAPAEFTLASDVLYVFDGARPPNNVVAYDLRRGRELWRFDSNPATAYETVSRAGNLTLLVPDACVSSGTVNTIAIDTASGREVWRRAGVPHQPVAGGRLMIISRPGPTFGCTTAPTLSELEPIYWDAVDLATGAVAWSARIPPYARIFLDQTGPAGARWALFAERDATLTSRNLSTGAVTGRLSVPGLALPPTPISPGQQTVSTSTNDLAVVGDLAVVARRSARRFASLAGVLEITAYDLATLTPRWSVQTAVGRAARRSGDYYGVGACGPMLCLYGPSGTVFFDPADGAERWRTPLSLLAVDGDLALFSVNRPNVSETTLNGLTVRDLRTGRERMALDGWRILSGQIGTVADQVLGFTAGDATWFSRLQLHGSRLVALGSAPGWYGSCTTEPDFFACRRVDGSVQVWRVPGR